MSQSCNRKMSHKRKSISAKQHLLSIRYLDENTIKHWHEVWDIIGIGIAPWHDSNAVLLPKNHIVLACEFNVRAADPELAVQDCLPVLQLSRIRAQANNVTCNVNQIQKL